MMLSSSQSRRFQAHHARLEGLIAEQMTRPKPDPVVLQKAKRDKLKIKDALERDREMRRQAERHRASAG